MIIKSNVKRNINRTTKNQHVKIEINKLNNIISEALTPLFICIILFFYNYCLFQKLFLSFNMVYISKLVLIFFSGIFNKNMI